MNEINNSVAFFLILVAFGIGYWIVSLLFKRYNLPKFDHSDKCGNINNNGNERDQRYEKSHVDQSEQRHTNKAAYFCELLELKGDVSVENIKKKYREKLAKYHPDKVSHLGNEFQEIAEKKTREINAAYDYFKQQYGF